MFDILPNIIIIQNVTSDFFDYEDLVLYPKGTNNQLVRSSPTFQGNGDFYSYLFSVETIEKSYTGATVSWYSAGYFQMTLLQSLTATPTYQVNQGSAGAQCNLSDYQYSYVGVA